jgi:ABC-2 type transport system permease protein
MVMMARVPFDVPVWQVLLSLGLLYATFVGMVWLSAKIYRTGILMYGKKATFRELWKWVWFK